MNTLKRIKIYIQSQGISISKFERSVNYSNGSFSSQLKHNRTIGVDKLEKIVSTYTDLNPIWALTGEGPMILDRSDIINEDRAKYIILKNSENLTDMLDTIIHQNNKILAHLDKKA